MIGSTPGSRSPEAHWTTPSEIGISGSRPKPMTRAKRRLQTTGSPFLERASSTPNFQSRKLLILLSGPAWGYDEKTDQWYCHTFLKEQPDLNWENPEVRTAIWDMMHWWMKQGCDGFRMDVVSISIPRLSHFVGSCLNRSTSLPRLRAILMHLSSTPPGIISPLATCRLTDREYTTISRRCTERYWRDTISFGGLLPASHGFASGLTCYQRR